MTTAVRREALSVVEQAYSVHRLQGSGVCVVWHGHRHVPVGMTRTVSRSYSEVT